MLVSGAVFVGSAGGPDAVSFVLAKAAAAVAISPLGASAVLTRPEHRPPGVDAEQMLNFLRCLASVMTLDYLRAEAAQGRRNDFLAVLGKVPDVQPMVGDERP